MKLKQIKISVLQMVVSILLHRYQMCIFPQVDDRNWSLTLIAFFFSFFISFDERPHDSGN